MGSPIFYTEELKRLKIYNLLHHFLVQLGDCEAILSQGNWKLLRFFTNIILCDTPVLLSTEEIRDFAERYLQDAADPWTRAR